MGAGYHGGFGKTHGQKEWDNLIASLAANSPNEAENAVEEDNTENTVTLIDMAANDPAAAESSVSATKDSSDSNIDSTTTSKDIPQDPFKYLPGPCDEMYIKQLEDEQAHFTKDDIIFITKDKTGQIVWLEKGRDKHTIINDNGEKEERGSSGLKHIIERHAADLHNMFGINTTEIASFVKEVTNTWNLEYSVLTRNANNSKETYQRLYQKDGRFYVVNSVAKNGFISSCYPVDGKDIAKMEAKAKVLYNQQLSNGIKYIAYNVI